MMRSDRGSAACAGGHRSGRRPSLLVRNQGRGSCYPDLARDPEAVLADHVGDADDALPGVAVSVIRGGESVYRNVAGVRNAGPQILWSVDDAFHIGSDTKAMTALVCGVLIDRGLLAFDTTIGEVLGAGYTMREEYRAGDSRRAALSHLRHPGELPGKTWATFFPYDSSAGADRARMVKEALSLRLSTRRSEFAYSTWVRRCGLPGRTGDGQELGNADGGGSSFASAWRARVRPAGSRRWRFDDSGCALGALTGSRRPALRRADNPLALDPPALCMRACRTSRSTWPCSGAADRHRGPTAGERGDPG